MQVNITHTFPKQQAILVTICQMHSFCSYQKGSHKSEGILLSEDQRKKNNIQEKIQSKYAYVFNVLEDTS